MEYNNQNNNNNDDNNHQNNNINNENNNNQFELEMDTLNSSITSSTASVSPHATITSPTIVSGVPSPNEGFHIVDQSQMDQMKLDESKPPLVDPVPTYSRWDYRFYTRSHLNETRLIVGAMLYKFAFETLSSALGLVVLTRFDSYGVTLLAVMNIVYFLCQSIGSILVGPFVRRFRPSRVTSIVFLLMTLIISFLLILEAGFGGTRTKLGTWDKWLITPVYIVMGTSVGMVEVSRKLVPRQILGNDPTKLAKLNGLVHLFYELSGTAGAFLSTVMIQQMGGVYAMLHMPPFFIAASICLFVVAQPFPPQQELITKSTNTHHNKFMSIVSSIGHEMGQYGKTVYHGAIRICNRKFWWILPTYVLPQVLHRLLENLLFPVFAKKILKDGSLSGLMTGGSNFGELTGALAVVKFGQRVKNPMWWVRADGLLCSLVWVLAYPPLTGLTPIQTAGSICLIMIMVSASWAAGDISILSFIQSSFPLNVASNDITSTNPDQPEEMAKDTPSETQSETEEVVTLEDVSESSSKVKQSYVNKEENDTDEDNPAEGSPLASVMGFLFAVYAIIISLLSFGLGRIMDIYAAQHNIQRGFFYIAGVGFSSCGAVAILATLFTPKFK